jgi:hypothetical protein
MNMKRVLPAVVVLASAGALLWGIGYQPRGRNPLSGIQEAAQEPPFQEQPLKFLSQDIDLGTVKDAPTAKARFEFLNGGAETITIRQISASCSCMVTKPTRETFRPGESGTIEAEISLTGQKRGLRVYAVDVDYDDSSHHSTRLQVTVRKEVVVQVVPEQLEITVVGDQPGRALFRLFDSRDKPARATAIESTSDALTGRVLQQLPRRLEASSCLMEAIYQHHGVLPGTYVETLTVRTDDPSHPYFDVKVTLHKMPRIEVAPRIVRLGKGTATNPSSARIFIRDREGKAIRIVEVLPSADVLECHYDPSAAPRTFVTVQLKSTCVDLQAFPVHLTIRLSEPLPKEETVVIMCEPH